MIFNIDLFGIHFPQSASDLLMSRVIHQQSARSLVTIAMSLVVTQH